MSFHSTNNALFTTHKTNKRCFFQLLVHSKVHGLIVNSAMNLLDLLEFLDKLHWIRRKRGMILKSLLLSNKSLFQIIYSTELSCSLEVVFVRIFQVLLFDISQ